MSLSEIRTLITKTGLVISLICLIPLLAYFFKFYNYPISDNPLDWGVFGDYIGGTLGTALAFVALFLSLLSVYITSKLSENIHNKEINLIQLQTSPLFYLDLSRFSNRIEIKMQNNGLGPLIITSWKVKFKDTDYNNFNNLFFHNLKIYSLDSEILYNGAPTHVLAPNSEKSLLSVKPSKDENTQYVLTIMAIEQILHDSEITINFKDVFDRTDTYTTKLDFFG